MTRCVDCPDLPNGTRKRQHCCRTAEGRLKIGDVIPHVLPQPAIRPEFTGAGRSSFKPARNAKRGAGG